MRDKVWLLLILGLLALGACHHDHTAPEEEGLECHWVPDPTSGGSVLECH